MKQRVRSFGLLIGLLIITLLMTGCLGLGKWGASDKELIRNFLGQVEDAVKAMDSKKVADLWHYPISINGTLKDREYMKSELYIKFSDMKDDEIVILEYKIMVNEDDIEVDPRGDLAFIKKGKVYMQIEKDGTVLPEETRDLGPAELTKRNLKWKFSALDWDLFYGFD